VIVEEVIALGAFCWMLRVVELGELMAVLRFMKRATRES
jgi:hypothetical protein